MVRETARRWGLRVWDKPAAACLSSRVAYGVPIRRDRLGRIERAESELRRSLTARGVPVRDLRVRDLGEHARIEVDAALVPAVGAHPDLTGEVVRAAGFSSWELDPRGYRTGAMNERV